MTAALLEVETAAAPRRLLPFGGDPIDRAEYLELFGALPAVSDRELLAALEAAGLTGRGGAGFPTATKLRAVRARRGAVVVANGVEGEPASAKDDVLLSCNPHLVVDGLLLAARIVGADQAVVAVSRHGAALPSLAAALASRRDAASVTVAALPERFVAGEETALVHWLNGGAAKPTFAPPRPFERGVAGQPTLVQNVETLANLALIARYGPEWFRSAGTRAEPGSVLVTAGGAVARPGVIEVELGTPIDDVLARCGGVTEELQGILVGGYFGRWVPAQPGIRLSDESLGRYGAALGARAIVALPRSVCGLVETARVAAYMAGESAGQCGPCVFGLPALAAAVETLAQAKPAAGNALQRVSALRTQIARRGACAHPDGVLGFVSSALDVFDEEVQLHLAGRCSAHEHAPVLPIPVLPREWR